MWTFCAVAAEPLPKKKKKKKFGVHSNLTRDSDNWPTFECSFQQKNKIKL